MSDKIRIFDYVKGLEREGRLKEAVLHLKAFLKENESLDDKTRADLLNIAGKNLIRLSSYQEASYVFEQALLYGKKSDYYSGRAVTMALFAYMKAITGNLAEASNILDKAWIELGKSLDVEKKRECEALILGTQGYVDLSKGELKKAEAELLRSMALWSLIGDTAETLWVANMLGRVFYLEGNYPDAVNQWKSTAKTAEQFGYNRIAATCYNNLGVVLSKSGDYQRALEFYTRFRDLNEQQQMMEKLGTAYYNIGTLHVTVGNFEAALKNFSASEEIFSTNWDVKGLRLAIAGQAEVYYHLGDLQSSRRLFEQSLDYFKRSEYEELLVETLSKYITLLIDLNDIDNAFDSLEKVRQLAKKHQSKIETIYFRYMQACVEKAMENTGTARVIFQQVIRRAEETHLFEIAAKSRLHLAQIHFNDDPDKADELIEQAAASCEEHRVFPLLVDILLIQAAFYLDRALDFDRARETLEKAREISVNKKFEARERKVKALEDQLLRKMNLMGMLTDEQAKAAFRSLAREEASYLINSVLRKWETDSSTLNRVYMVIYKLDRGMTRVFYSELKRERPRALIDLKSFHGQTGVYFSYAIYQGTFDKTVTGLYGPLPVSDLKGYFALVYSTDWGENVSSANSGTSYLFSLLVPKEILAGLYDRDRISEAFEDFMKRVPAGTVDEKAIQDLKNRLIWQNSLTGT
ncbi:MAG: tetratricopeptide repeat protein [Candidatus Odinarchaeota archaeon]